MIRVHISDHRQISQALFVANNLQNGVIVLDELLKRYACVGATEQDARQATQNADRGESSQGISENTEHCLLAFPNHPHARGNQKQGPRFSEHVERVHCCAAYHECAADRREDRTDDEGPIDGATRDERGEDCDERPAAREREQKDAAFEIARRAREHRLHQRDAQADAADDSARNQPAVRARDDARREQNRANREHEEPRERRGLDELPKEHEHADDDEDCAADQLFLPFLVGTREIILSLHFASASLNLPRGYHTRRVLCCVESNVRELLAVAKVFRDNTPLLFVAQYALTPSCR